MSRNARSIALWGLVVTVLSAAATVVGLFISVGCETQRGSEGEELLVQKGELTRDPGTYEVFYPREYESPPHLEWKSYKETPAEFEFLEQRADGFVIVIRKKYSLPHPWDPNWIAEGIPVRAPHVTPRQNKEHRIRDDTGLRE